MPELSESNTGHSIETQLQETNLEVARAQLRKLNLEIENLKPKRRWPETIVSYIPIITALISVGGLLSGIIIFTSQQEADRISRDKMQFLNSYDQLLQFSANPNMTAHRAVFLHDEINKLIDSIYRDAKEKEDAKETLKRYILGMISVECDYTQTRHVQLDIAGFKSWKQYEKDLNILMTKYYDALREINVRYPGYFQNVDYDQRSGYRGLPSEPTISFEGLKKGFTFRLQLLDNEEKERAIERFGTCLNNPTLAASLFNDRSDDENILAQAEGAAEGSQGQARSAPPLDRSPLTH